MKRVNFCAAADVCLPLLGRAAGTLLMAVLLASFTAAQTVDRGTIRGRVADQNGAVVAGASVTVTNEELGLTREVRTDEGGNYTVAGLPLTGSYKVTIGSSGFAIKEVTAVTLRADAAATIDAALAPAGVSTETITITSTADTVQADTAQLDTRLDAQKIEETPVFGRKITNLMQLNSAVRPARGTGDLFLNNFLFVVNGSGRRQTTVQIDGSTGDDAWGRQTLFTNVPLAALQEFTIITNGVSAEYGRTTGSAVNIVTKTGTNDYHFDLIGVARPGGLQARTPGAARRTIDRLGQFSGIVSGPLRRDRTHFLLGAEASIQRRDSLISSPLAPGTAYAGDYHQGLFFGRIDHQFNARNLLTLRANADRFTDTNPADAVGGTNLPSGARKFSRRTYAAQVTETATLSPVLLNEARFQFQVGSPITQFTPISPSPQFVRTGVSTEGESRSAVLINHQYEFADTLSLTRGRQYLKFGGNAIFSTSGGNGQEFGSGFVQGQFTFAGGAGCTNNNTVCVPTSQLTLAQVARYTQSFGNANYNVREWLWSVFAQDNVRVRPDLTLNLGLRYERQTFTDDKNNFAPRVGFAYNLFRDQRTVLRGSYGIYYSEIRANTGAQFALAGPTGVFTFTATPGQLGFPTSFAPLPAFPAGASVPARDITIRPGRAAYYASFGIDTTRLRGYPDKLLNPYTQQATFGVQRELPWKFFLNVDYVYAHTIGIDRTQDLNAPSTFIPTRLGQTRSGAAADATRPITPGANGYRRILVVVNNGSSVYHGMQVNLNKRFTRHFALLASYTWSHTINTVEPDAPGGDPLDVNFPLAAERANSLLDQRHRAVISGWYRLPYDFTFGGETIMASGRPYNVTIGTDVNGDGANNDRPFDFATGTFLGRNTGRGTPVYQTDLFIERTFRMGEHAQLGLRAEGFNVFNHSNLVARNGVLYGTFNTTTQTRSALFGTPTLGINGIDPPREFQFQVRLRY